MNSDILTTEKVKWKKSDLTTGGEDLVEQGLPLFN